MTTGLKSGGVRAKYYLKDVDDRNTTIIHLVKKSNQFTVIFKEGSQDEIEQQINLIKPLIGGAQLDKLCPYIYLVRGSEQESMRWVNNAMRKIRRDTPIIASHVYSQEGDENVIYYLTKKIIVALKPDINSGEAGRIVAQLEDSYKLKWVHGYKSLPNTHLLELRRDSTENPIKIANALARHNRVNVDYAEPSLIRFLVSASPAAVKTEAEKVSKDSDSLSRKQWYLESINVPAAWEKLGGTKGNEDIHVAIIDRHFMVDHPAFADRVVTREFDFVEPATPFKDILKDHGTNCAGLIFAKDNSPLISGIAPGCSFIPVRISDLTADDELLIAGEKIGPFVDIVSCSFGPDLPSDSHISISLRKQITNLATSGGRRGKGILFCFSAGNFNLPISEEVEAGLSYINALGLPDAMRTRRTIHSPYATHRRVMAVAACTKNNGKANYSNYGKEISVCAPGSDLLPFPEENLSKDDANWIFTTAAIEGELNDGKYTNRFGGTSTSAALLAGVAALVLSANTTLTAEELRLILENSADKIKINAASLKGTLGEYDDGEGDQMRAHSKWFGYGKVDAGLAVERALEKLARDFPV